MLQGASYPNSTKTHTHTQNYLISILYSIHIKPQEFDNETLYEHKI